MSPRASRERGERDFEAFVAERGDAVVALARGLSAFDEDADGLAERALARAWRRWRRLRSDDGGGEVAYGAVVRAMVDLAPSVGGEPALVETRDGEDVDLDDLDAGGRHADVGEGHVGDPVAALRRAEPSQRVVLLLRWLEGRDDAAIGRLLRVDAAEAGQRGRVALEAAGFARHA